MIPSLRGQAVVQAGVGLLACFVFLPHNVNAAPIKSVGVSAATTQGEVPDSVRKRIESSISAIGNRVFVGKEENIFRLNAVQYNKVLADIVNRVVIGYMVSDLQVVYGTHTSISVELQPVGEIIRTVSTEIDYGNLTEEAAKYVQKRHDFRTGAYDGITDRSSRGFRGVGGKCFPICWTGFDETDSS